MSCQGGLMKRLDLKHLIFLFFDLPFANFQNCSNPNSSSNSTSDAEKLSSTLSKTYPLNLIPPSILLLSPEKSVFKCPPVSPASTLPVQKLKWGETRLFLFVCWSQSADRFAKNWGVINMDWLNFQSLQSVEAVIQCPIPLLRWWIHWNGFAKSKLCKTIKPWIPNLLDATNTRGQWVLLSPQGNPVRLRTDDCSTNSVTDFCEAEDRANFRRATSEIYKSIFIKPTEETVGPAFCRGIPIPMHSNCKFHSYIEPQAIVVSSKRFHQKRSKL